MRSVEIGSPSDVIDRLDFPNSVRPNWKNHWKSGTIPAALPKPSWYIWWTPNTKTSFSCKANLILLAVIIMLGRSCTCSYFNFVKFIFGSPWLDVKAIESRITLKSFQAIDGDRDRPIASYWQVSIIFVKVCMYVGAMSENICNNARNKTINI